MKKLKHSKWIDGILTHMEMFFETIEQAIDYCEGESPNIHPLLQNKDTLNGIVKIYDEDNRIVYQVFPIEYITYA